jgi:replicative DNA helicase
MAPPHSIEAEQSVLGAVLLSDKVHYAYVIEEGLRPEDFYRERHRVIYQSMLDLYNESEPIDVVTVTEHLRSRGELDAAGGPAEIDGLTAAVPAVGNLRRYGQIVREASLLRKVLAATYEIQASVHNHEAPPRDIVERAEKAMLEVGRDDRQKDFRRVGEVLHDEVERWHVLSTEGRSLTGTPSGFSDLDEITGGFQPGNMIIVAARPSMGKSALVTNFAENVALNPERPRPVALFSLEMSESELAQRFIASQASIKGDDLRKGRLKDERKWKRVLETAARYDSSPLFVDDSSDIGILEVRAKARRLHQQTMAEYGGLGMVIVDYLQLMRTDARVENRVQAVGEVSRGLKILARELAVPVIALSQLSRGVESRNDKRPMLSDLRECVTGDTLVLLADGSRTPIAALVGREPEVLALDAHDRIVRARAEAVWPVGRRDVYELRLASGRRLRCTADHRIRAGAGWARAEELHPGDRVALSRRLPEPERTVSWPDDHLVLLAHLVGDGSYVAGRPVHYDSPSSECCGAVAEAAERAFGARVARYAGEGGWERLVLADGLGDGGLQEWLRTLGIHGHRARDKRLPAAAFRLGDRQIGLLLRHLWATDGTIWVETRGDGRPVRRIAWATPSSRLADDVAALLLRLGIVARTVVSAAERGAATYSVVVAGAAAELAFLDRVGAFGPRSAGAELLRAALSHRERRTLSATPLLASRGSSARAAVLEVARGGATMARQLDLAEQAAAAASDVFWDRVIDVVPAGEHEVYDLTVPGPASWLADGIVSHNSGQIEQDADLVMFIYRDEYYHENTERPGEADLIIAKHRNGGLGDVPLTFQGEYPRFLGIQRAG